MKCCILHVLCEGPTEVGFAKKVLVPYLAPFSIYAKPISLCTSRKKNAFGGVVSYTKIHNDLGPIFASIRPSAYETYIVTTMLDLYAIPQDMPGYAESVQYNDPYERVRFLEDAFARAVNNRFFIPYIQLHEFEALLFSDISKLIVDYPNAAKEIIALKSDTDRIGNGNPELINHGVNTAPSKRIIKCLEKKYHYDKVRSGAGVASQISLNVILERCEHFRKWVENIINLSELLEAEK